MATLPPTSPNRSPIQAPITRKPAQTSFPRKIWRLLVAIKDGLALLFLLLFFGLLFSILSARPNAGEIREGALLLDLNGSLVEELAAIDPVDVLLSGSLPTASFKVRDLVAAIDAAAEDDRINSIALDLTTFLGGGQTHIREVAEAFDRFRAADKPIYTYAIAYSDDSMMLAAHSSEVWVDPMGGVVLRGPGGQRQYYKAALDRFGINAHVFRVGTYKNAVEPYLGNGMSDPSRESTQAIYDALWGEWLANVGSARPDADWERAAQDLAGLIAENDGDLSKASLAAGLVDSIGTREEWGKHIAETAGADEWNETPGSFAYTELAPWLVETANDNSTGGFGGSDGTIGVITISGEINDSMAGPGTAGAARIAGLLDNALNDELSALVVRVDSPGGTVTGSETIRRAIMRHKDAGIPIAVSMGNYAASGGYWVSTPADRIFAAPDTLTGSIGVYSVVPTFEKALAEYGVTSDGVTTTPMSGQPDLLGGLTPETEAVLQATSNNTYDMFLSLVAKARNMDLAKADELGQGRVWVGGTAHQLGLVDQFGDLDDAIAWAAAEAGLEAGGLEEGDWGVTYLGDNAQNVSPLINQLLGMAEAPQARGTDIISLLTAREQSMAARLIGDIDHLLSTPGMQARCIECIVLDPPSANSKSEQALLSRLRTRFGLSGLFTRF